MGEPRIIQGARALLFERLVDPDPHPPRRGASPRVLGGAELRRSARLRVLDGAELRESVRREVERLLNTRCTIPLEALEGRERTVLEYGLPDITPLYTRNPDDQAELAARIRHAVSAYEPRLREVRVTVEPLENSQRELRACIEGALVVGEVVEPVFFSVNVSV